MPNAIPKSAKLPLAIAAIGIVGAILIAPLFIRTSKCRGGQTQQTNNLRQIGFALYEFENDYGSYPSEATAGLVTKKHPDQGYDLSGTSSNAIFRQLFAAEITQSEDMFYAKIQGSRKPDGDITRGHLLEPGECSFAYVTGLKTEGNPARPLAFWPVLPGTHKLDRKLANGKAVVLRVDNSVSTMQINGDGEIVAGDGQLLLSPENPIWDGQKPDIRYPE